VDRGWKSFSRRLLDHRVAFKEVDGDARRNGLTGVIAGVPFGFSDVGTRVFSKVLDHFFEISEKDTLAILNEELNLRWRLGQESSHSSGQVPTQRPGILPRVPATAELREEIALHFGEVAIGHRAVRVLLLQRKPALHPGERLTQFAAGLEHGGHHEAVVRREPRLLAERDVGRHVLLLCVDGPENLVPSTTHIVAMIKLPLSPETTKSAPQTGRPA
jgi:hypothetical protein